MWHVVDVVFAKCFVLGMLERAGSGREISKNGGRMRRKTQKCHGTFQKAVRQAISTRAGHSPDHSSSFLSVWRQSASLFWHLPQTNKQTLSITVT